jgi:hypothetical protein
MKQRHSELISPVQVRVLAFYSCRAVTQQRCRLKEYHPLWLEIMKTSHSNPLDFVAAPPLDFDPQAVLTSQTPQYEGVPLNEIFDLLESAVETYTAIAPTLPQRLRESAEQEIDFFYSLTQKRLGSLINQPKLIHLSDDRVAA